jgi:hypothetical protein
MRVNARGFDSPCVRIRDRAYKLKTIKISGAAMEDR